MGENLLIILAPAFEPPELNPGWVKMRYTPLASVAHWLKRHSPKPRVKASIPGQGSCLGGGFSHVSGHVEATNKCFSLTSMFLSLSILPLPLSKINKHAFR